MQVQNAIMQKALSEIKHLKPRSIHGIIHTTSQVDIGLFEEHHKARKIRVGGGVSHLLSTSWGIFNSS